ncbi:hypothetical protein ACFQ1Q_07425 [Winogradskyella litorisediminis]|uniref:Uncharacterized protein n=1 Tax=Winogradskyella litorisediminis TaxID=1156618 RepID=A0ABW3N6V4_9FLAO
MILNGERTIYKVEIINSEYSTELRFKSKDVKVPLNNLPIGRYTVIVRLANKLIAINLLRQEPFKDINVNDVNVNLVSKTRKLSQLKDRNISEIYEDDTNSLVTKASRNKNEQNNTRSSRKSQIAKLNKSNIERRKPRSNNENPRSNSRRIAYSNNKSSTGFNNQNNIDSLKENNKASGRKGVMLNITKSGTRRNIEGYWIVKTSQGHIGKKIIRHFATIEDLDNLISRIKLEHNTRSGKHNTLQIWEVYNLDAFKIEQAKDRNYIKVSDSPYFNIKPYFDSTIEASN